MQLETAEVSTGVDQVGVKQGMCEASFWKARAHKKLEGEERVTPNWWNQHNLPCVRCNLSLLKNPQGGSETVSRKVSLLYQWATGSVLDTWHKNKEMLGW